MKERIQTFVKQYEKQMICDLKEFASIPAPSHQEEKRSAWLIHYLKKELGVLAKEDDCHNVIYEYRNTTSNELHCVMAHIDIVFDDLDTIQIVERDGKLFGCGIGDDSANVIVMLYVLRYLIMFEVKLSYRLLFVFDVCEEGLGNLLGSKTILKDYPSIKCMSALDLGIGHVVNQAVGSLRYELIVEAQGGHSYEHYGNTNAITQMAEILVDLDQMPVGLKGKSTKNAGVIQGGTTINSIAKHCRLTYELRSDQHDDLRKMKESFYSIIKKHQENKRITCQLIGERSCGIVDQIKMDQLLEKVYEAHKLFGINQLEIQSGSTDCNTFLSAGIPAICFGCYIGDLEHTRNEWIQTDSLITGLSIALAYFLQDER